MIDLGDYQFEVVEFPGHTPHMQGLYERNHKILFGGVHILQRITPNITFWSFEVGDSLGQYLKSLDKAREMDIDLLLSSHRELLPDHRARIDELKEHHQHRLDEALTMLRKKGKPQRAIDLTRVMSWNIRAKNWEEFPIGQKVFAGGETLAHLENLRAKDLVTMQIDENGVAWYEAK